MLKVAAPIITSEAIDSMINRITGGAPEMSTAVNSLLVKPWLENQSAADAAAAAAAISEHEALIAGILDPTMMAKGYAAGAQVGANMTSGVAVGLEDSQAVANAHAAAKKIVDGILNIMQVVGQGHSPFRLFATEVGANITEGVAQGMLERDIFIDSAARHVVGVAMVAFDNALANTPLGSMGLSGATTGSPFTNQFGEAIPDYVWQNSPYLKGLLEDPEKLIYEDPWGNTSLPGGINWVWTPGKGWGPAPTVPDVLPKGYAYDPIKGGNFGPLGATEMHIQLHLDSKVVAETVVNPWLEQQTTTEALSWGVT